MILILILSCFVYVFSVFFNKFFEIISIAEYWIDWIDRWQSRDREQHVTTEILCYCKYFLVFTFFLSTLFTAFVYPRDFSCFPFHLQTFSLKFSERPRKILFQNSQLERDGSQNLSPAFVCSLVCFNEKKKEEKSHHSCSITSFAIVRRTRLAKEWSKHPS